MIVTCVRWYLRFSLSLRDVEELMAERNLTVDHTMFRMLYPVHSLLGSGIRSGSS